MRTLAFLLLLAATPALSAQTGAEAMARKVADAYGFANWPKVQSLAFTFNAQLPKKTVKRTWFWETATDRITLTAEDGKPVTYLRSEVASDESLVEVDQQFINDTYWLLFPFHLVWDQGMTLTEITGPMPLPIGDGEAANKLTVQYSNEVGYTPGDAYDLYLSGDGIVLAWAFRKGGAEKPNLVTSWSTPEEFGPIRIASDHPGENGFRLWFTDVKATSK